MNTSPKLNRKYILRDLNFQNFLGGLTAPPEPPYRSGCARFARSRWSENSMMCVYSKYSCGRPCLHVAQDLRTVASLIGQGDNQVILLKLPTTTELANLFTKTLRIEAERLGMELKEEETWSSTVLFEYNKKCYLYGLEVCSALKNASKLTSDRNVGIPTFATQVGAYFSGGLAIAGAHSQPGPGYLCAEIGAPERGHGFDRCPSDSIAPRPATLRRISGRDLLWFLLPGSHGSTDSCNSTDYGSRAL